MPRDIFVQQDIMENRRMVHLGVPNVSRPQHQPRGQPQLQIVIFQREIIQTILVNMRLIVIAHIMAEILVVLIVAVAAVPLHKIKSPARCGRIFFILNITFSHN